MVDYSKQSMRGIDQEMPSPGQNHEHSDNSDTDFQARAVESEAEETADEGTEVVNIEELNPNEKHPSRGLARSLDSPQKSRNGTSRDISSTISLFQNPPSVFKSAYLPILC